MLFAAAAYAIADITLSPIAFAASFRMPPLRYAIAIFAADDYAFAMPPVDSHWLSISCHAAAAIFAADIFSP